MRETKQHVILVILKVTTGNILFTVHRWCHTFLKIPFFMRLQRHGTLIGSNIKNENQIFQLSFENKTLT